MRTLLLALLFPLWLVSPGLHAQLEKTDVHIAVGGKSGLYYLPLVLTERLNHFKDEGLNVRISDFAGGTRSLEAVVGGSADVVAGAYEHTINMQSRKQSFQAFVLAGASPQISVAISSKLAAKYKSPQGPEGPEGRGERPRLEHQHGSQLPARPRRSQADRCGDHRHRRRCERDRGNGSGRVDVVSQTDPAVTMLEKDGKVKLIAETRTPEGTQKLFGGPMPASSLYAPLDFIKKEPEYRTGADQRDGAHAAMDAGRLAAADPRHGPGGIPARQQGDVSLRLQQRQNGVFQGRLHQRSRREDDSQGAGFVSTPTSSLPRSTWRRRTPTSS
jgi:hypothetical protein